jgi:hypothetical protein
MNGYDCDGGDDGDHRGKHDEDEPCGAVRGLRRGLRYAHGVDERVRNEMDELHVSSMFGSLRMVAEIMRAGMLQR